MVQLGRRYGTGPASLAEIAIDEDLPRAYLEQLVTSLRDAKLVVSTRGARCTVNVLWVRVRDAITGTLDAMTLAHLVPARHIDLEPNPTLTGAHS